MITAAWYGQVWQAPWPVTGTPLRVVIAEDDDALAALIEDVLRRDGRFVVLGRARDGDEAVQLVERHTPDLVLMDIGMPGTDGITATRRITKRNARQHVVIYTGSNEYDDVARADAAGAVGFLHKDALTSPDLPHALHVLHASHVLDLPHPDYG
jgi:DNA-binding NarL/FixJ family response regulator